MQILETAEALAREAGSLLREALGGVRDVEYKGVIDLVTEMDKKAEDLIVRGLRESFPDHGILTEESVETPSSSPFRWIIDPIDGTTNYAHGYPVFCVSIAFEEAGVVRSGVVFDPMQDECFSAQRGGGAFLNNTPITVSKTDSLDKSLLATGFPYDVRTSPENNLNNFSSFALRAQAIRRAGAAALDLSNVACGRLDGFWELKLKPWDLAAAVLIIEEAGGTITGLKGEDFGIFDGDVLATNGLIHSEMLEVLAASEHNNRSDPDNVPEKTGKKGKEGAP